MENKEQLISFETAKLTKEKQFQEYTSYFYTEETGLCSIDGDGDILNIYNNDLTLKDIIWDCNGDFWYNEIEDEEDVYAQTYEPIKYPAPTQSLLQKWLREKHKIHITIFSSSQESWMFRITKPNQMLTEGIYGEDFITYEEALEVGLQEALKLI